MTPINFQKIKSQLVPDANVIQSLHQKLAQEQPMKKSGKDVFLKMVMPVAACFLLLIGVLVYSHNFDIDPSPGPGGTSDADHSQDNPWSKEIKGLPVDNFAVQDVELSVNFCRAWFWSCLPDFFSEEHNGGMKPDAFVIVRVTDTQGLEAPLETVEKFGETFQIKSGSDRQTSTVSVLKSVWGDAVPESFQIVQYDYSHTSIGPTNMLRKGGVYLLPLRDISGEYYDDGNGHEGNYGENCYSFGGSDLDVLFEIDDQGRVYSHSHFEGFSRFDGKKHTELTDAIVSVSQSPDLPLMLSPFGRAVLTEKLARVEIISTTSHEDSDPWVYYNARVTFGLGSAQGEDMLVYYSLPEGSATKDSLRPGSCYLMFGHVNDGYMGVNPEFGSWWKHAAEILPDGTIRAEVPDDSVFSDYNGYTVDEIKQIVETVNQFAER